MTTIRGYTTDGSKFRPSQWASMLVGESNASASLFVSEGATGIKVSKTSDDYERVISFAKSNQLTVEE